MQLLPTHPHPGHQRAQEQHRHSRRARPCMRTSMPPTTALCAVLLWARLLRPLLICPNSLLHMFSLHSSYHPVCSSPLMQQLTGTSGTECSKRIAQISVCFGQHFIYVICEDKWQSSHTLWESRQPQAGWAEGAGKSKETVPVTSR